MSRLKNISIRKNHTDLFVQIILIYLVVRDIFAVGSMISYYNVIIGTIYFSAALIVILIIIVNNKIKGNWIDIGFFIKWISIVVGSLFFFLFTESILMIISGWNSHRMIVLIFDFIFINH